MYGGGEVSPQTPSSFHCFACSAAAVCTLRLVSRRWDAVFWSEPSLSLDFRPVLSLPPAEQEQWLAGKLQLLQRVRGMVKSVYLLCSTSEDPCWAKDWAAAAASIQACQQQLQPGIPGLQSLALYWGAVAPLGYFEALLPFSQARVALTLSCFHVPAAATPGLGQLQQLKELAVAHFPREVVPAEPPLHAAPTAALPVSWSSWRGERRSVRSARMHACCLPTHTHTSAGLTRRGLAAQQFTRRGLAAQQREQRGAGCCVCVHSSARRPWPGAGLAQQTRE